MINLEVIWDHLGSFGGQTGVIQESSGVILEVILGSSGGHLGVIWVHLGVIWGSSGNHLGVIWGPFGWSFRAHLGGHPAIIRAPAKYKIAQSRISHAVHFRPVPPPKLKLRTFTN